MQIAVIGAGYVGLVSGVCFASLGFKVSIIDKNEEKINLLNKGIIPIFEEGLEDILKQNRQNLNFSTKVEVVKDADVIFIAVGTPQDSKTGKANLKFLQKAAKEIAPFLKENTLIVIKSTVPPKTNDDFQKIIEKSVKTKVYFASNPEFLREGSGVKDFLYPERIIIGVEDDFSRQKLEFLYAKIIANGAKFIVTDITSAELSKYASNTFLATKVAFINEISNLCFKLNANIDDISKIMGLDSRIGTKFLQAGPGFGGSCFPKDIFALENISKQHKAKSHITQAVIKANEKRIENILQHIQNISGSIKNKNISVLGLAFKAGTDDIRSSPAIYIVEKLLKKGAKINAHDFKALQNAKNYFLKQKNISFFDNAEDAIAKKTQLILILTEWKEYIQIDFEKLLNENKSLKIFDTRNLLKKHVENKRYFSL